MRPEIGPIALARTGPFVPPMAKAFPVWYVRAEVKEALLNAGALPSHFQTLEVQKCVPSDWEKWDDGAGLPTIQPVVRRIPKQLSSRAEGEPEGYVARGQDNVHLRASLPTLYRVDAPFMPTAFRRTTIVGSAWADAPWGTNSNGGAGMLVVREQLREALEISVGPWIRFEPLQSA